MVVACFLFIACACGVDADCDGDDCIVNAIMFPSVAGFSSVPTGSSLQPA